MPPFAGGRCAQRAWCTGRRDFIGEQLPDASAHTVRAGGGPANYLSTRVSYVAVSLARIAHHPNRLQRARMDWPHSTATWLAPPIEPPVSTIALGCVRDVADETQPVTRADHLGAERGESLVNDGAGLEIADIVRRVVHELEMPDAAVDELPRVVRAGSQQTHRWRQVDSNHRSRVGKSGRCQVPAIRPGSVEH
jgi:hypothetical protein